LGEKPPKTTKTFEKEAKNPQNNMKTGQNSPKIGPKGQKDHHPYLGASQSIFLTFISKTNENSSETVLKQGC
jgi:hypothetical protein